MKQITEKQIAAYQVYLAQAEKSAATAAKYLHSVTAFRAWLCGRAVERAAVLEYKAHLSAIYAPAGVNAALSALNSFFDFCGRPDCKVKTLRIQRRIFASEEKELTKTEYARLLAAAAGQKNRRLALLMQTVCSTGIRVSEIRFITVEAARCGEAQIYCKGKTRRVFLPRRLCCMLLGYAKERKLASGAIFVTRSGKPLDRSNIWREMKQLCIAAGVSEKKVFPHNLRHLFARTYYAQQKDIVRLADILGHGSVNTTRIYTMESGAVHKRQIERLGLLHPRGFTT